MAITVRDTEAVVVTVPAGQTVQVQPDASDAGQTYFQIVRLYTTSRDLVLGNANVVAQTGNTPVDYPRTVEVFHRDDLPYVANVGSSSATLVVGLRVVTGTL
jgi:hypothetical protein